MLTKKQKYTDFNGMEREETLHFNMTEAEVTLMELSINGTFSEQIKAYLEGVNTSAQVEMVKNFILQSYGEKSLDGKHFRKSQQIRDDFEATQAFSEFFMSLISDPNNVAEFIAGISPIKDEEKVKLKKEALEKIAEMTPSNMVSSLSN